MRGHDGKELLSVFHFCKLVFSNPAIRCSRPGSRVPNSGFTCLSNLTGTPALAVPTAPAGGLPTGVQLMAPAFAEDRLRMLRAVRFAARLGFIIDPACETPLIELPHLLESVPAARLFDELAVGDAARVHPLTQACLDLVHAFGRALESHRASQLFGLAAHLIPVVLGLLGWKLFWFRPIEAPYTKAKVSG